MNSRYNFKECERKLSIHHYTVSRAALKRLDLNDLVTYYITNNIDNFKSNFEAILRNRKMYSDYEYRYRLITNTEHHYNEEIIKSEFGSLEKFIKFEKRLINKIKYKNDFELTVNVVATYTSPKGRNSYHKSGEFNFSNVLYCYNTNNNRKEYTLSVEYERSLMTASLRYDVLKRDNYKCRICGASAHDGAELHVDHIYPVSKGGKTEISNLQTLCERCNLGKSNKI